MFVRKQKILQNKRNNCHHHHHLPIVPSPRPNECNIQITLSTRRNKNKIVGRYRTAGIGNADKTELLRVTERTSDWLLSG